MSTKSNILEENLKAMKIVLDFLNIPFWLACGTLLGVVRDNDFIAHDSDIDLGIFIEDWKPDIIKAAKSHGFDLYKQFGTNNTGLEYSFIRKGLKLDLFFFYKDIKRKYHWMAIRGGKGMKLTCRYNFPLISSFDKINFKGEKFNIPKNSKAHIVSQYGQDWKTPVKDWDYFYSPFNIERMDNKIGTEPSVLADRRKKAKEVLLDFKKIIDDLGMVFMLDGGTLLGAVRDGQFPEDDENDIDLTVLLDKPSDAGEAMQIIAERASAIGFRLYHSWQRDTELHRTAQIALKRDDIKVDLMFKEKKNDRAWWTVYRGSKEPVYKSVPVEYYKYGVGINFLDVGFIVPNDVENYLKLRYGDWKIPVHRRDYNCYTSDKVIVENYEKI